MKTKIILMTIVFISLPLNFVCQFLGIITYSLYFGFMSGWRGTKNWLHDR